LVSEEVEEEDWGSGWGVVVVVRGRVEKEGKREGEVKSGVGMVIDGWIGICVCVCVCVEGSDGEYRDG
jgi:hypothetical protein